MDLTVPNRASLYKAQLLLLDGTSVSVNIPSLESSFRQTRWKRKEGKEMKEIESFLTSLALDLESEL